MSIGIYISVPFCRSKCSFCNFASGVFPAQKMARYSEIVAADLHRAPLLAANYGAELDRLADTIYFGGGTPSLLPPADFERIISSLRSTFNIGDDCEFTVECAPNSISDETLTAMLACGVDRISFGAQSFVDRETASVARLHKAEDTLRDVERIRAAGIDNISIDLIAGLPHQTLESWKHSVQQVISLGVPHVSIYMLEVDVGSRLGRELIAGGTRYHAHTVPHDDLVASMYEVACERLENAGVKQYEISNFARSGFQSKHNLKYWNRDPYIGFGADAHSMLPVKVAAELSPRLREHAAESVRFASGDDLNDFMASAAHCPEPPTIVTVRAAFEEAIFLGLRLNRGLSPEQLRARYGFDLYDEFNDEIRDLSQAALLEDYDGRVRLTARGRMISNSVFERFIADPIAQHALVGERV